MEIESESPMAKFLATSRRVSEADKSPNYPMCNELVREIGENVLHKIIDFNIAAYTPTKNSFASFVSSRTNLNN